MLELFGTALAQRTSTTAGGAANVAPIVTVDAPTFTEFFGRIVTIALFIGGALAVIYLIYGGVLYVTAAGDQEKATAGRTAIVNAVIGVIVIGLALALVTWLNNALGGGTI